MPGQRMPGRRISAGEAAALGTSILISAFAQVCLRLGASSAAGEGAVRTVLAALSHPFVLLGLGLFAVGTVLWLVVLSRVDLSIAYPMGGASYAVIAVAGIVMGEAVTPLRLGGMLLIGAGVALVGRGGHA